MKKGESYKRNGVFLSFPFRLAFEFRNILKISFALSLSECFKFCPRVEIQAGILVWLQKKKPKSGWFANIGISPHLKTKPLSSASKPWLQRNKLKSGSFENRYIQYIWNSLKSKCDYRRTNSNLVHLQILEFFENFPTF